MRVKSTSTPVPTQLHVQGSYRAAACGPELISIADEDEAEVAEAKLATSLGSCIASIG